jgi:hypothetical protein
MAKKNEIELSIREWSLLRQSLDIITIQGKDARMVAELQTKLDIHISTNTAPPQQ